MNLSLTLETPGKLRATEVHRRLLLPVEELHVGAVTDQQTRHLPPLLLTRGVKRGVAIPSHDHGIITHHHHHHTPHCVYN